MPIIKSSIKRVKQDKVKTARNRHYKSEMKSLMKIVVDYCAAGETDKAKKMLSKAIKAIDTAAKKKIIHKKNAARKKSLLERTFTAAVKNPKAAPEKKAKK
ncbi:30S ribosomal protein S20 [Candidatus Peregrinibacteria bacterium]|nr:30S ribosomal protein S20 [Candidatus Peregrinibacteria bacterium]